MNQLEKWDSDGVISLRFPEHAQREAEAGNNACRREKSRRFLIPFAAITTEDERKLLSEIKTIIFGNAPLSQQDENDAAIVFIAKKYSAILITGDGALLRAADQLHRRVNVQVMNDENAVKIVRQLISGRDSMARFDATRQDVPLPDWVGND